MKKTSSITRRNLLAVLALVFSSAVSNQASAQNLIINPGFTDGTAGWSTDCSVEIYAENVYGGVSASNNVTEIDAERCFNQIVNVNAGATYLVSYKASRRQDAITPATVGVNVTVTGVETGTQYINNNRTYTNTTWSYTNEVFSFTLPLNSTDTRVNVKFSNYLTGGTYGTIVDDINLSTSASVVLPLKFLGFSGKINNNSSQLIWSASNDDNTGKYFVVEKSSDQQKFDSIGVVNVSQSATKYAFTDNNMSNGTMYYRIKAVNTNSISYTNIIRLGNNSTATGVKVFPNPATSTIGLSLSSTSNTVATLQVCNISGNVIMTKQVVLNEGANAISMDVTSLNSGSFFLKVSDNKGLNFARSFAKK